MPIRDEGPRRQAAGWWEVADSSARLPSVRWLGVFRRKLRLEARRPAVVQVPGVLAGRCTTTTCIARESGRQARESTVWRVLKASFSCGRRLARKYR